MHEEGLVLGLSVGAVFAVGHGMSEGDRMHVNEFSDYVRDVVQHLEIIHKKYPDSPIFLLGHSMVWLTLGCFYGRSMECICV